MLNRLKVWQQLTLFALIIIMPLALSLVYILSGVTREVELRESERQGATIIAALVPIQKDLALHRGTVALAKSGNSQAASQLGILATNIDSAFDKALTVVSENPISSDAEKMLRRLQQDWHNLNSNLGTMDALSSFNSHTGIIKQLVAVYRVIAEDAMLALSSDASTHILAPLTTDTLPHLVEDIGKLRGSFSPVLKNFVSSGVVHEADLATALGLQLTIDERIQMLETEVKRVGQLDSERHRQLVQILSESMNSMKQMINGFNQRVATMESHSTLPDTAVDTFFQLATIALGEIFSLWDIALQDMQRQADTIKEQALLHRNLSLFGGVIVVLLSAGFGFLIIRNLSHSLGGEPMELETIANNIAGGMLDQELAERTGVYGQLRSMRDQLRERNQREMEQMVKMTRLQQAVETTSTALMVADEQFNIVYMNPSVKRVLKAAEPEIKKSLPQFNADQLQGQCIDFFHKNPAHQRQLLTQLKSPHDASLMLGDSHFDLTAGTIRDSKEEILGFVVEWRDMTDQVMAENEVQKLVGAAKQGDLKERLSLEGKEGFFLSLAQGLNEFVQIVDAVLDDIDAVVSKMAQGDLSGRMDANYEGQYLNISDSVNDSVDRLNGIVSQLLVSTEGVRAANQEISTGNNQLSERTEKQSSGLEETASSMEELASNVRNTADNSRQADQLSSLARESAAKGGEVVKRTVSSMTEINEASRKIAEIIGVIDDIAFQTNLLALNASVEAARAGEQGRGFAVVATEVRNLAQRSATSAKEIKELIEDSVKKVQAGSELVNESGVTLDDIIANVKKVSDLISDIAAATEEQSSGIDQINRAITELDEITQQNAALAEETASSAESSLDSVGQMVQVMSFFQADESSAISLAPRTTNYPVHGVAGAHHTHKDYGSHKGQVAFKDNGKGGRYGQDSGKGNSKGNNKSGSANVSREAMQSSKPESDDDWEVF